MAGRTGSSDVRWRLLHAGMWAARRDGRHLGTVELGHRWLAVDADSEPIGRFRTLAEAQAAVADPSAHRTAVLPPRAGTIVVAAATASAAAIVAAWPGVSELIR